MRCDFEKGFGTVPPTEIVMRGLDPRIHLVKRFF
jgi:hypothetical protein